MKKKVFIKNAMLLTATALLLRTVGMIFRVYMSNKIGAEGMGLYQLIFSVYILAATFATSGVSTAVTRLITDELVCGTKKSVLRILHRSIVLTVLIGAVMTLTVFFSATFIAENLINDARAIPALKILSFSLIFMGVSSCIKGYFIARRKAGTPCVSQIFEQAIRIFIVMYMLGSNANRGIAYGCFAILLGDTLAETGSCLFVYFAYKLESRKLQVQNLIKCQPITHVTKNILKIAVPISAGRYLHSALHTVENLIVPNCLEKYIGSREQSLSIFGMLKGMAMPIIFFPSSFLMSISTLLIPEISEANALHENLKIKRDVSKVISITLTSSILVSGIFLLVAEHLGQLMYDSSEVGFLIKVLSPLIPVMYLESVVDGMLKGLNQQNHSLVYSAADSLIRIALIFLLVPKYGIAGFLAMMIFSNAFTCYLNLRRLLKVTNLKFKTLNWVIKPLISAFFAVFTAYFCLGPLNLSLILYVVCVTLISTFIFIICLFLLKGVSSKNISIDKIFA